MNDSASLAAGEVEAGAKDALPESGVSLAAICVKALRSAANYGHWDLYKSLLARSKGTVHGVLAAEALAISAEAGDTETTSALLEGESIQPENMGVALAKAVKNGHVEIVQLLLDHDAIRAWAKLRDPRFTGATPQLSAFNATITQSLEAAQVNIGRRQVRPEATIRKVASGS